jgi:hypothetical protein
MAGRAQLRASDADRESVSERLRKAAGEGRLRTEELEQRIELALSARTYGQLQRLIEDLPGRPLMKRSGAERLARLPRQLAAATVVLLVLALVSALIAGVLASWWLWAIGAWLLFGHRGRRCAGRLGHRRYRYWSERGLPGEGSAGHWV